MNRHLRNFAFLLLGFGLTLLAGYASAGWYVDDGYSHSGGNLNRQAHGNAAAGSSATVTVNGSNVEVNRSWSQAMGEGAAGAAAAAAVNVFSKIPKGAVVNAARGAVSVSPMGLAGSILAQHLLQQAWQWNPDPNQWLKPPPAETYSGTWQSPDGLTGSHDGRMNAYCGAIGWSGCYVHATDHPFHYIKAPDHGTWVLIWVAPETPAGTPVPASEADIVFEMERLVDATPADVLRELAQRNIELAGVSQSITQLAEALSLKMPVETGTENLPDGSTRTWQKDQQQKYEIPSGELPAESPVPVKQSTVTTTTTNVYNTDNSVTTTTNTTTTNNNPAGGAPKEEQKTDCDKKPDSIGCSDWGDAPDGPAIDTQEINPTFSWSPFTLPSTCPAPQQLALSFGTKTLSWQPACDFATKFRPLVLAFAGLAALYLMFGMKQDG